MTPTDETVWRVYLAAFGGYPAGLPGPLHGRLLAAHLTGIRDRERQARDGGRR